MLSTLPFDVFASAMPSPTRNCARHRSMFASIGPPSPALNTLTMRSAALVESAPPGTVYCSVRNCTEGCTQIHDTGFGPESPAALSTLASLAAVELASLLQFDGGATVLDAAAEAGKLGARGGATGAVGNFGGGEFSPHAANVARAVSRRQVRSAVRMYIRYALPYAHSTRTFPPVSQWSNLHECPRTTLGIVGVGAGWRRCSDRSATRCSANRV